MSPKNQISEEIPKTVLEDVAKKLEECQTALAPYLQALTAEQSKSLFKMGDKTLATVQKTKSYLQTNPEFAPVYLDQKEFLKDEALASGLTPLLNRARQLASDLEDTVIISGNEALLAALLYYGTAKEAADKGISTAQPIYEDLSQRFARKPYKKRSPKN